MRAAFEEHDIGRIVARAYRANTPSIALMELLGMTFILLLDPGPVDDIVLFGLESPDRSD